LKLVEKRGSEAGDDDYTGHEQNALDYTPHCTAALGHA
jgi:hypothetical protein